MAVYGSLHHRTYDRGSAAEINGVYILWWYIITSPSHLLQRRYSRITEYVLWWYVITLPSNLQQSFYAGDIWSIYYGGMKFLRPRTYDSLSTAEIYGVYTMVVHNNFAIAPTKEEIYRKSGVYTMAV